MEVLTAKDSLLHLTPGSRMSREVNCVTHNDTDHSIGIWTVSKKSDPDLDSEYIMDQTGSIMSDCTASTVPCTGERNYVSADDHRTS
jgi:hypothetical protein